MSVLEMASYVILDVQRKEKDLTLWVLNKADLDNGVSSVVKVLEIGDNM